MILFENNGFPPNHPFSKVAAMPTGVPLPPIWLLGSSDYSARACRACRRGIFLCVSFLGFPAGNPDADLPQPVQAVGVAATRPTRSSASRRSAPTPKPRPTAWRRARTCISRAARMGDIGPLASPDEAAAYRLHADRPPAHRTQSQAADRRLGRARCTSASLRSQRVDPGRRGDDHHDGVRSCGAQAFV